MDLVKRGEREENAMVTTVFIRSGLPIFKHVYLGTSNFIGEMCLCLLVKVFIIGYQPASSASALHITFHISCERKE